MFILVSRCETEKVSEGDRQILKGQIDNKTRANIFTSLRHFGPLVDVGKLLNLCQFLL